jgi:fucose permease
MFSFLLAIIYMAFISLGLPDSLLGAAWPVMHTDLAVPLSCMGVLSMLIAGGTIVSSLMSDYMTKKLGTGLVTAVSVFMTAAALFGFSISHSFAVLCLWAIPYGLGAGAVDAALNNYVALHYASRHMNWLHCFWGVGTSISPYIMGYCLSDGSGWQSGYRTVSAMQIVLTVMLFLSLPMWNKNTVDTDSAEKSTSAIGIQMASAYVGTTFMPPLFGVLAGRLGLSFFPIYMLIFVILMILMYETLNRTLRNR